MGRQLRILHVIAGLQTGGAERILEKVCVGLSAHGIDSTVASMTRGGAVADSMRAQNVSVIDLDMQGPAHFPFARLRLKRAIEALKPDLVQGWMYHGNLLAMISAPRAIPVSFNIRHSLPALRDEKFLTQLIIRAGSGLSRRACSIVYNSQAARLQHQALGYFGKRALCIPNGFDTVKFRPSLLARVETRARLGVAENEFLLGHVGRFHEVKNQRLLLEAISVFRRSGGKGRFVLAGRGIPGSMAGLDAYAKALQVDDVVQLLEEERDIPALMNAFDVLCLTSNGEGFPNVVGEAMACGTNVISTDVGDVRALLGGTGWVVPVGDVSAVANAIREACNTGSEQRLADSRASRSRIEELFSDARMLDAYATMYGAVARHS